MRTPIRAAEETGNGARRNHHVIRNPRRRAGEGPFRQTASVRRSRLPSWNAFGQPDRKPYTEEPAKILALLTCYAHFAGRSRCPPSASSTRPVCRTRPGREDSASPSVPRAPGGRTVGSGAAENPSPRTRSVEAARKGDRFLDEANDPFTPCGFTSAGLAAAMARMYGIEPDRNREGQRGTVRDGHAIRRAGDARTRDCRRTPAGVRARSGARRRPDRGAGSFSVVPARRGREGELRPPGG